MIFCNNTIRVIFLLLLSSQVSSIHALTEDNEMNGLIVATDSSSQQTGIIPLAPPGPYFSSADPKETAISDPIQMPASVPVSEQADQLVEKIAVEKENKVPEQSLSTGSSEPEAGSNSSDQQAEMSETKSNIQTEKSPYNGSQATKQNQSTNQTQNADHIESTNPLAKWPRGVESDSKWAPAPPAPPGPYGFVPNYTPRSMGNSTDRYRDMNSYNPRNNAYGRPAPRMMPPQPGRGYSTPGYVNPGYVNPDYANPGFSNQGYYYGRPNPGGYNQGNYNRGGFDPRIKRNNLNQNDINQAKPKY